MNNRLRIFILALCSLVGLQALAIDPPPPVDSFTREVRPVLDKYCISCHNASKMKGGINFAAFTNTVSVYRDHKTWEKAAEKLRADEMPPEGKPRPAAEQRTNIVAWIDKTLQDLDQGLIARDPGRVLIHRLSRTEYNNTLRDLLGVDSKPADKFPSEGGGGGGFDNNADTLFIPPILMEKYLDAAVDVLDKAPHDRIFVAHKGAFTSERAAARKIIEHFAMLGFRRPVNADESNRLLAIYEHGRKSGKAFEPAVKSAIIAVLISPNFLFRIEQDESTAQPYHIDDYELASRLSYFLWSSMPDDELFKLAAENRLHEPKVLDKQVQRMLLSPNSRALSDNFAGQWLRVRELQTSAQPDGNRFPTYTPALRDAMYLEVIDFFDSILRENRSVLEVLSADYTYANGELAANYGIKGVSGPEMRRVELKDGNRGGVLSMAAVLTLTSYPLRTSPVLRGKWVLEQILGTPPPPPPPLVPSLPHDDKPVDGLTLRQRLEKHRSDAQCAGCHKSMDPLGFGLENFDPIGRWRDKIADAPVDVSGELPDGTKFSGPAELKKVLLNRKDDFVRNLTEKMLAYALGRGLDYYDVSTVRQISKDLAAHGYSSNRLITDVVESYPFQFRRNAPVPQFGSR